MNDLIYPVILTYEDNVIYVGLPDFNENNCLTYGETLSEALQSAKEVLALELISLEEEGKEFPKPSNINNLKKSLNQNQEILYLSIWLPYEKAQSKTVYKKKTLSIPVWLDLLATEKNINFSQVLQKALKDELGIK